MSRYVNERAADIRLHWPAPEYTPQTDRRPESYALVHRSANPSGFDRPSTSSSTVTYHQHHQPALYYRPALYHQDSPHRYHRNYLDQEHLYHNNSQRRITTTTATSRPMVYRDGTVSRYHRSTVVTPKVYHHPQEPSYRRERERQRLYIDNGALVRYNRDEDGRYRGRVLDRTTYHDQRYVPRHAQQRYSRGYELEGGYGRYGRDSSYRRDPRPVTCCTIT